MPFVQIVDSQIPIRQLFYGFHFCLCDDFNAFLFEHETQTFGQSRVKIRQNFLAVFHYGYLTSKSVENGRKFESDDTAADNAERVRQLGEIENGGGCQYPGKFHTRYGEHLRNRPCGDYDMRCSVLFITAFNTDSVRLNKIGLSLNHVNARRLE